MQLGAWKVCSICRKPIAFKSSYFICSVSTCQRKRTGLVFCSAACFDAHSPMLRHRDAWAESATAPTEAEAALEAAEDSDQAAQDSATKTAGPVRRVASVAQPFVVSSEDADDEVLVVASRLKKFVRNQSGMNTSEGVLTVLSEHLRQLSVQALRQAAADGRKTVMERDYETALRLLKGK